MPDHQKLDDRTWLANQVTKYKGRYPDYQRYAKLLDGVLKRAAADLAPLAIIQTRPKSIASFAGKALIKRHKYHDPVSQLTDLCGARIICRTRAEVEAMSEFVKQSFDVDSRNSLDCSQRLKTTEFGYRSVHYIVELRKDQKEAYGASIPRKTLGKKSEIQIRTVVEHAYADFAHDLTYKGSFELPKEWERELAGVAAALEEADLTFSRIEEKLTLYATNYGAYLSAEQLKKEIENKAIILEHDPENAELAVSLAKLAQMAEDWDKAEQVLEPFVDAEAPKKAPQPVLRELGTTKCKKYPAGTEEYKKGQSYLELASAPEFEDVDAICSWAGSWKQIDEARAGKIYRQAFETDPYNAYALGNHLEYELQHNPGVLAAARPLMKEAIKRCQGHVDAKVNLPWAYFDMGKFHLLMDEPERSLEAFCKAISVSSASFMLETSLSSLNHLRHLSGQLKGFEMARRLLLLGLAARFGSPDRSGAIGQLSTGGVAPIGAPVLIVAGGTDPRIEGRMQAYSDLLMEALSAFAGTIISGGTTQGVSGLVGDIAQAKPGQFHTLGYLPDLIPKDATRDNDPSRYQEIRHTDGHGFSALEPLQNWIDLIASGVPIDRVRVLGINGGAISAAEYRIALALGARVGLISGSGREAGAIFTDPHWSTAQNLLDLPEDPDTVRAFVDFGGQQLPEKVKEVGESIAKAIHEGYRRERMASPTLDDPALADWKALHADYQASNRDQARHIMEKLRAIGCTYVTTGTGPDESVAFTPSEIEIMARMEHGRWVVERLLAGWRPGEERDPEKKTNPHLVGWSQLTEDVKDYDRQTVRKIPEFLDKAKLQIRRNR